MKSICYNTNEVKEAIFQVQILKTNKTEQWVVDSVGIFVILQLDSIAEIGLIQLSHNNASDTTPYAITCLEPYANGDSYNITSAVLYLQKFYHIINEFVITLTK